MSSINSQEILYVVVALLFQLALIIHFSIRKWAYGIIEKFGWFFYVLSLPAAAVSFLLLLNRSPWGYWVGGFVFLVWAIYGYTVEYRLGIQWRNPPLWRVLGPFVTLYLATAMFYWWPLALLNRTLWYVAGVMFLISTTLNITSHKGPADQVSPA